MQEHEGDVHRQAERRLAWGAEARAWHTPEPADAHRGGEQEKVEAPKDGHRGAGGQRPAGSYESLGRVEVREDEREERHPAAELKQLAE